MIHQLDSESLEPVDGWLFPRCSCSWSFGPVPDMETFIDVLMEHAQRGGEAKADRSA